MYTQAWPKTCGCGRSHDRGAWQSLECIGSMELDDEQDIELRNCACRTTLAVPVKKASFAKNDAA